MRYDGMINQRIADEYKLDAFRIVGSLIKTSQEVCIHMIRETGPFAEMAINGKYPMDLLPKIVNIVKGYKGAVAGLDITNYFIFRNHWGCRHVFIPTRFTDSDKEVMAKNASKPDKESNFVPKELGNYEKTLGVTVNKDIFTLLNNDIKLDNTPTGKGAFFNPNTNTVHIPFDDRRRNSKWYAEAVVYHEYGHAIDEQRDIFKSKEVQDLMDKYRKSIDFEEINEKLWELGYSASAKGKYDEVEKIGATHDTLGALKPSLEVGHKPEYWAIDGNPEREFIAHAIENNFAGNDVFEKLMPELYKEMISMIKKLKPI